MSHLEPTQGKRITAAELARLPDIVDALARQGLCVTKTQIFSAGDGAFLELSKVVQDPEPEIPPPAEPEEESPAPEDEEEEEPEKVAETPLQKLRSIPKFKRKGK